MDGAGGTTEDFVFDVGDPALLVDPYPVFHRLRERAPMYRTPLGYWVATRHDDVREILRHKAFGQGDFVANIRMLYGPDFDVLGHSAYRWLSSIFVMQDPPDHTRLRGLVTQALSARRVQAMRPRIAEITDRLLDDWLPRGQGDFITDFAYKLPTLVMCDMLGMRPEEVEGDTLARLNQAIADAFLVFELRPLGEAELALADRQMDYLTDWFNALFDRRRAEPRDDLTTALIQAGDGGDRLSPHELAVVVIGLFGAGFETTAHMLGNGMLTFHRNRDQWAALKADPALAPNAVEEVLRFESSLQATHRTAFADTEIGGVTVRAGERVLTLLSAANRDPAMFVDPDRFDIARADVRPLSFGGGIHFCVGAELARVEGQVAFTTLARRLPGDWTVDERAIAWRHGFLFRGLTTLPLRWTP